MVASATPEVLKNQTPSTSIIVIGCGHHALIDHWKSIAECPFPVFTHPTVQIHKTLGFVFTQENRDSTGYYKANMLQSAFNAASQAFWKLPAGLSASGGSPMNNGGEFVFESTPTGEKTVTWCHRMQHATDHTQPRDIFKVLGVKEVNGGGDERGEVCSVESGDCSKQSVE